MLLMDMAYVSATIVIGFGCGSALPGVGGSGVALRGRFFYIWHCWTAKLFWLGYRWSLPWGASGTALHVAGTANTVLTVSGHFRRRVQPIAIVLASGFGTTLVERICTSSLVLLILHPRWARMLLISLGNAARLWDTMLTPGDGWLTQGSWSTWAAALFARFRPIYLAIATQYRGRAFRSTALPAAMLRSTTGRPLCPATRLPSCCGAEHGSRACVLSNITYPLASTAHSVIIQNEY